MGRRLAANVVLRNPKTGVGEVFEAGQVPPDWAVAAITNPAVFASDDTSGDGDSTEEPPRAGPGSGKDAWRTYAVDVLGIVVRDDASRDDIIGLVDGTFDDASDDDQ